MKMTIPTKAIYGFNAVPIKTLTPSFTELKDNHLKIHMEGQKNPDSQSNREHKEYCWRHQRAQSQVIWQNHSNKNSIISTEKQMHKTVEYKT